MTSRAVPCLGSTHLLFPPEDVELETPAPPFCFTCPERLDCAVQGWNEKYGIWGGLTLLDRMEAKRRGQSVEEALQHHQ